MSSQIDGQMSIFDYIEGINQKAKITFDPLMEYVSKQIFGCDTRVKRLVEPLKDIADMKTKVKFLKDFYGIGGYGSSSYSPENTYKLCGESHDAKGLKIEYYEPGKMRGEYTTKAYSFKEVAEAIDKYIQKNQKAWPA